MKVLFKGLSAPVSQILTLVFAFLTICVGITILQMSKIDPAHLSSLDRRSTLLLQAARARTDPSGPLYPGSEGDEAEKSLTGLEDPGIDTLRGLFGTVGSMSRARTVRRLSQSSRGGSSVRTAGRGLGVGGGMVGSLESVPFSALHHADHAYDGMTRHHLYDAPVPSTPSLQNLRGDNADQASSTSKSPRQTAIKFGAQDVVHSYTPAGIKDGGGEKHSAIRPAAAQAGTSNDLDERTQSYEYPPKTGPQSILEEETNTLSSSPPSLSSVQYTSPRLQNPTQSSQFMASPQGTTDEPSRQYTTDSQMDGANPFRTPDLPTASFRPTSDSTSPSPIESDESPSFFTGSTNSVVPVGGSSAKASSGRRGSIIHAGVRQSQEETRPLRVRRSNSTTQSPRRYPLRGVNDVEERMGLWERPPADECDDDGGIVEQPGIRLVQQPSSRTGDLF